MNINDPAPMGSAVTAVESDETDQGHDKRAAGLRAISSTPLRLSNAAAKVRSFEVGRVTRKDPPALLRKHLSPAAHLATHESVIYGGLTSPIM
jgi:hypothetical protein